RLIAELIGIGQRKSLDEPFAADLKQTAVADGPGLPAASGSPIVAPFERQAQERGEGPLFAFLLSIPRKFPAIHIRRPAFLKRLEPFRFGNGRPVGVDEAVDQQLRPEAREGTLRS